MEELIEILIKQNDTVLTCFARALKHSEKQKESLEEVENNEQ